MDFNRAMRERTPAERQREHSSSWMQGAFESGRDVSMAIHRRVLSRS